VFTIRRMTMADKPAMFDISSRIWEGTDYLPGVFDRWVADPDGEFAAIEVDGKLAGCGKLTFLTPSDAWLEGLRKDPLVKEKGLAEEVARHFLGRLASRPGLSSVRFSTYVRNLASIRSNEKVGFRRRTTLCVKAREGTPEELHLDIARTERVEVITEPGRVLAFLRQTGYFQSLEGLVVEGWKTWPWSEKFLVDHYVAPGFCRGLAGPAGLRALSIVTVAGIPPRTSVRLVCLDAVNDESAGIMVDDVLAQTHRAVQGARSTRWEIEWMIPKVPRLQGWAARGGFKSWEQEDDFLVYEMPLDLLPRFAPKKPGAASA
jgi:hypothetical protein